MGAPGWRDRLITQLVSVLSFSTQVIFWTRLTFFFFNSTRIFFSSQISNCSHDISLVFFFRSWTYILQISTHFFYCIRCILQVLAYVLCFQHVFIIDMILSATERHSQLPLFNKPATLDQYNIGTDWFLRNHNFRPNCTPLSSTTITNPTTAAKKKWLFSCLLFTAHV